MSKYLFAILITGFTLIFPMPSIYADSSSSGLENVLKLLPELSKQEKQLLQEMAHGRAGIRPQDEAVGPESGSTISRYFGKADPPDLVPLTAFRDEVLQQIRELTPDIGVETLLLYPLESGDSEEELNHILYDILTSVSTMEGIEYYSASRNRNRLLFEKSYRVAEDENTRLPDPEKLSVPGSMQMKVLQKDLTFGENLYRVQYRATEQGVLLFMRNITRMTYGIFPAVKPEGLHIYIAVIPAGEHLLFYGASAADTAGIPFFASKARTSFYNRIVALYSWFAERFEAETAS